VLAAAASGEPVAATGFSAGAIAILTAAAREPQRFTRIAVLGIGDHVLTGDGDLRPLAAALRNPDEPDDVRERTLWRLVRHSGNDPAQVAAFLESAPLGVDSARLCRIRCPVLVVVGARDEAMPADGLAEALPDAHLTVLPGVDHFGTVSSPAAIDAVTRFLTTGEGHDAPDSS
jgi:pimeloyl-ACP methyl ester carboxylesterase